MGNQKKCSRCKGVYPIEFYCKPNTLKVKAHNNYCKYCLKEVLEAINEREKWEEKIPEKVYCENKLEKTSKMTKLPIKEVKRLLSTYIHKEIREGKVVNGVFKPKDLIYTWNNNLINNKINMNNSIKSFTDRIKKESDIIIRPNEVLSFLIYKGYISDEWVVSEDKAELLKSIQETKVNDWKILLAREIMITQEIELEILNWLKCNK